MAAIPPGFHDVPLHKRMELLRRDMPPELASAVSEQLDLRARAAARGFPSAHLWLYSADGLEMVTHPTVASRRAQRLTKLGLPIADLTCGIGGDLAALAEVSEGAIGVDHSLVSVLFARQNVPAAGVVRGDATSPPLDLSHFAVVLDPARREGGARTFDPARFTPPWDECLRVAAEAPAAAMKTQPGIPAAAIPSGAEVEFVQLGRSLREAAIYLGAAASFAGTRAVHLPSGEEIDSRAKQSDAEPVLPRGIVYDPESCVTRAGLVRHLAHRLDARMLDPQVAYLTANEAFSTSLAAAFEVVDVLPFSVARLRQFLRAHGFAAQEIRRRAFPIEPDELRKLLGAQTGEPVALLCTTLQGKRTVIVGRRVARESLLSRFEANGGETVQAARQ